MRGSAFLLLLFTACGARPFPQLTPLVIAARGGDIAAIHDCISHGADPDAPSGGNGWTPLEHAIHRNQIASVSALLAGGANVNAFSSGTDGMTPLMMAAGYGYTDIARLLLRHGADPRIADHGGFHAIDLAVAGIPEIDRFTLFRCQDDTIRLLRAAAPDVRLDSRVALWGRTKRCAG
ncbi:MAG TPA: ankyrin repeat domain-containing protein [Thermoanaerobaculia bacterium]|nr:ankyrin repeat domain-containing protein [Thermoanaerobaculia bacterium]